MFRMFYCTIWQESAEDLIAPEVRRNLQSLFASPRLLAELKELLIWNYNRIDFIDEPVGLGFACPLDLYCSYTRDLVVG